MRARIREHLQSPRHTRCVQLARAHTHRHSHELSVRFFHILRLSLHSPLPSPHRLPSPTRMRYARGARLCPAPLSSSLTVPPTFPRPPAPSALAAPPQTTLQRTPRG
jgi:hypothetical protein